MATLGNERPLQGWKAIADYLNCSVKTAQRRERRGLPVHRHDALGVIAYPSEIADWVKRVKEADPSEIPASEPPAGPVQSHLTVAVASTGGRHRRYLVAGAWAMLAAVVSSAVLANSYGLAILMLWVGAIFLLARLGNTLFQRVFAAAYLIAAMAYTCSASTMPEFQDTVINSTTLAPAAAFLFVLGLKFIPLFVLVLGYAVAFPCVKLRTGWRKAYTFLGVLLLTVEFIFLGLTSGDERVWQAGVPGRWTLLIASAAILALNLMVWLAGQRCFQAESLSGLRPLLLIGGAAYLGVAVAAFFVDHEHNRINHYYLDVRWPEAYIAANPGAVQHFREARPRDLDGEVGPDLAAILSDPGFLKALYHGRFYKQHSDEPFQLIHRAVIYSYRPSSPSTFQPSPFVTIRFPKELADALMFQPVGETK